MSTVPVWSGHEVRAFREARRMTVREFAAHLEVSERIVARWEKGGERIRPGARNQAALDRSLAMASADIRTRFAHITTGQLAPPPTGRRPASAPPMVPPGAVHYLRHPLDRKLMTLIEPGPFRPDPGRGSVWLTAYYIDVYPTTNAEYASFLAATDRRPPRHWRGGSYSGAVDQRTLHDEPVTGVSFEDARAYAFWTGKELPTTAQWERAARGSEGMVMTDLWEWVDTDTGPGRRGPQGLPTGGFRCASAVASMIELLAV